MTVTHSTTVSDVRVPWMTAWKMSRPKLSVPNGWEREGEDHEYFEKYAEKIAYPLAINIIVYIITH